MKWCRARGTGRATTRNRCRFPRGQLDAVAHRGHRVTNIGPLFIRPPLQQVDDVVVALDEALRPEANGVASRLRKAGRSVELVLESKKMKWVMKVRGDRPKACFAPGLADGHDSYPGAGVHTDSYLCNCSKPVNDMFWGIASPAPPLSGHCCIPVCNVHMQLLCLEPDLLLP